MARSLSVVLRDVLRARRFSELASLFPALGFASIDAYRHSVLAPRTQRSLNCTTQHSLQACTTHHPAFFTGTQLADGRAWPSDSRRLRFGHRRMLRALVPWRVLPEYSSTDSAQSLLSTGIDRSDKLRMHADRMGTRGTHNSHCAPGWRTGVSQWLQSALAAEQSSGAATGGRSA